MYSKPVRYQDPPKTAFVAAHRKSRAGVVYENYEHRDKEVLRAARKLAIAQRAMMTGQIRIG